MAGIAQFSAGPVCRPGKAKRTLIIAVMLTFLGVVAAPPGAAGQSLSPQNPDQSRFPQPVPKFPKPTQKQKQAMLAYNFKKLKQHAEDLTELAKSLQEEIEKSNQNVLSLEIVKKAAQAEKLAKKIKNEAKGF